MILHTVQATKDPIESLLSPEMLKIVFGDGATAKEPLPIEKAPTPDTPVAPADSVGKEPHPAMLHPAVARCVEANDKTFSKCLAAGYSRADASRAGDKSYRRAMPPLAGREDIRDFIACVAHGMLIGVFEAKDASRLIYAAQTAYSSALEPVNRLPGRPRRDLETSDPSQPCPRPPLVAPSNAE